MDKTLFPLSKTHVNQTVKIKKVFAQGAIKRRLLDLGFTNNTQIKCLYKNSSESFIAYLVLNSIIALRDEDADNIYCIECDVELNPQKSGGLYECY